MNDHDPNELAKIEARWFAANVTPTTLPATAAPVAQVHDTIEITVVGADSHCIHCGCHLPPSSWDASPSHTPCNCLCHPRPRP